MAVAPSNDVNMSQFVSGETQGKNQHCSNLIQMQMHSVFCSLYLIPINSFRMYLSILKSKSSLIVFKLIWAAWNWKRTATCYLNTYFNFLIVAAPSSPLRQATNEIYTPVSTIDANALNVMDPMTRSFMSQHGGEEALGKNTTKSSTVSLLAH